MTASTQSAARTTRMAGLRAQLADVRAQLRDVARDTMAAVKKAAKRRDDLLIEHTRTEHFN